MLTEVFSEVYNKFRIHFYMQVFSRFENREATLTTVESFSMECIKALGEPTIQEFANMMGISAPNAAYKVNSLIQKGYVEKIQSERDHREYHLRPTKRFDEYYDVNIRYVRLIDERCRKRLSPEDYQKLEELLKVVTKELMPELDISKFRKENKENRPLGV